MHTEDLLLKYFASENISASPGKVVGFILDGGLYGTDKTRASKLALRGARKIAYTFLPVNFCNKLYYVLYTVMAKAQSASFISYNILLQRVVQSEVLNIRFQIK